jgi:hypothetical protein
MDAERLGAGVNPRHDGTNDMQRRTRKPMTTRDDDMTAFKWSFARNERCSYALCCIRNDDMQMSHRTE